MNFHSTHTFGTSLSAKIITSGCIFVCFACFFTPLSTSLMAIFSGLAFLAWILSGRFLSLFQTIRSYPTVIPAVLLFMFMSVAIYYSPVEPLEALHTLKKYRELLLLPVVISLLSTSEKYREMAENSFITGCVILMIISFAMALHIIPEHRYGHSIVFHITHSFFMSVLAFWSLHRGLASKQYRWLWFFFFISSTINIFYIAPGRTGMLVFICLMLLFLVQRLPFVKCVIGLIFICTSITLFYYTSNNFSGRIEEMVQEIEYYKPGESRTSIGQRFDWWTSSITLIKEKPLFGHGTGSFGIVHQRLTSKTAIKATDNPHNEYLFITVQYGLLGLFLFLSLLILQFIQSFALPDLKKMLLQGVILALLSGSLINSLLFDSQQGHFFLFMSAALITAHTSKRNIII